MTEEKIIKRIDDRTDMLRQELGQRIDDRTDVLRQELEQKIDDRTDMLRQELGQKIEKNTNDIKDIKEILKEHSRALIIIEDAVTNKIPALFDKLSSHDDRFERDEERLEKIEKVTESNTNRITALELTTTGIQNN